MADRSYISSRSSSAKDWAPPARSGAGSSSHQGPLARRTSDAGGTPTRSGSWSPAVDSASGSLERLRAEVRTKDSTLQRSAEMGAELLEKVRRLERECAEAVAAREELSAEVSDLRRENKGLLVRVSDLCGAKRRLELEQIRCEEEKVDLARENDERSYCLRELQQRNQELRTFSLQRLPSAQSISAGATLETPRDATVLRSHHSMSLQASPARQESMRRTGGAHVDPAMAEELRLLREQNSVQKRKLDEQAIAAEDLKVECSVLQQRVRRAEGKAREAEAQRAEVEPHLEDAAVRVRGRPHEPASSVGGSEVEAAALARYLEELRAENEAYRTRPRPALGGCSPKHTPSQSSGDASFGPPTHRSENMLFHLPPPGARGPRSPMPRFKTVTVALGATTLTFKVFQGATEGQNIRALRSDFRIPEGAHVGVRDAAGRAARLSYGSVRDHQVYILHVTPGRCRRFTVQGCPEEFAVYEGLAAEALREVREALRLPPGVGLRFTDMDGAAIDLHYDCITDGQRLQWQAFQQVSRGGGVRPPSVSNSQQSSPYPSPRRPEASPFELAAHAPAPPAARRTRGAAAALAPAGPDTVWVDGGRNCPEATGEYVRCGPAQWATQEGRVLGISQRRGVWMLCADAAAADSDEAVLVSDTPAVPELGPVGVLWRSLRGGQWAADSSVAVLDRPPPSPSKRLCCGLF
eukprot:TRINITY_DN55022_c0_g1_i1.p1 TRINITY_DN55022_c0_g1~~TRINITY_DN55022_c0_g1_i1.p1  ORF type:complete len:696 (+),score=128.05 TRINITY_DN55022_c0_g1_i1:170-2257(+)